MVSDQKWIEKALYSNGNWSILLHKPFSNSRNAMIKSHFMWGAGWFLNMQVALLHARHNADPFSKFTFLSGKYKVGWMCISGIQNHKYTKMQIQKYTNFFLQEYNMTQLNITNVRDYAMFMALSSHKQVPWLQNAWEHIAIIIIKPIIVVKPTFSGYWSVSGLVEIPGGSWWQTTQSTLPGWWAQANDLWVGLPPNLKVNLLTHSRL